MRRSSRPRATTHPPGAHRPSAGASAAVLLLAAAHRALGRAHHHARTADDDRLWLYFTAAALDNQAEANALPARVVESMRAQGVPEDRVLCFQMM